MIKQLSRIALPAAVLAALLAVGTPAAGANGNAPTAPTGGPAAPAHSGKGLVITAKGVGPYRIGISTLSKLVRTGRATDVQEILPICPGHYTAHATARYTGRLLLRFQGERLVEVSTTDPAFRSERGGRVGMTLQDLQALFGARGTILTGVFGLRAFVVRHGDLVLAFFEDPDTPRVFRIAGGERERVLASFTGSDDRC